MQNGINGAQRVLLASIKLAGAGVDSSDYGYGGTYDKSTILKTARVVVTIDYAIEH